MGASQEKGTIIYALRLREELERIGFSKIASYLDVHRNTVANWAKNGNMPIDKMGDCAELGLDGGYVLTGLQSGEFDTRVKKLQEVTMLVQEIAPEYGVDPMELKEFRDLAYETNMNDKQIKRFFDLIENSSDIFPLKQLPIDVEFIEAGLQIALKCIDAGNAQDLSNKAKVEFITYVIKDLTSKHSIETPAIQNTTESNVTDFMQYLKQQQGIGG